MTAAVCPECGYDYDSDDPASLAARLDPLAGRMAAALAGTDPAVLGRRTRPEVWSPLEYACHLRDVLLVQRDRLYLALVEDGPSFARMYRDERVELAGYRDQDPVRLGDQMTVAAELAGEAFGRVDRAAWDRPLVYNWPEPRRLDIRWLAAHTAHEAVHHLRDFESGIP